jgi:RND family efflux transporter MFP subunit
MIQRGWFTPLRLLRHLQRVAGGARWGEIPRSAALLLAVSLISSSCSQEEEPLQEIIRPVLSVIVEPRDQTQSGFVGSIQPEVSASLSFRLLGRLVARDVDVGDVVTKGTTIAALDPQALQLQVQTARADLSSAQAQAANAAGSEERAKALLDSKNISQAQYDSALQARAAAQAGVTQAQAALAKAQEQLGYTQLFSDFDGVVTSASAEVGQVVNPGQTVVTVARSDVREAVVDIPDQMAVELKPGTEFTVALQSAPTITVPGKVREVAPQSDDMTRTRRVKLSLANPPVAFRLGSTVTVTRSVAVTPSIVLPASALLDEAGKTSVWVVDPAALTVGLRPIKVGVQGFGYFTVASGIEPGSRVVTAGVHSLTQGQKVRVDVEEIPQ